MKSQHAKKLLNSIFLVSLLVPGFIFADTKNVASDHSTDATIISNVFKMANENNNWKKSVITGKEAQVVYMSVSSYTNPKNEIGVEKHQFDQVIFVVEGKAKANLNGKISIVKSGDLIFVPKGFQHNFVNLNAATPFKIISVYSNTDMPKNTTFKTKADAS